MQQVLPPRRTLLTLAIVTSKIFLGLPLLVLLEECGWIGWTLATPSTKLLQCGHRSGMCMLNQTDPPRHGLLLPRTEVKTAWWSCFLLTINTCQFLQVRPWFDMTHFTTFPDLLTDQFTRFCYNCIFQADQPSESAWQRPSLPVVRHLGIHVFRREHIRPMLLVLRINKWNFLESVIWVIDMYLHIHSLWRRKIMEGFQLANKFCMLMQFVWIFSKIFIWRERLIIAWIIVLFPKASLLWITHCYPSTMLAHHWILPWWIKWVFFFILNQCQRSKSW